MEETNRDAQTKCAVQIVQYNFAAACPKGVSGKVLSEQSQRPPKMVFSGYLSKLNKNFWIFRAQDNCISYKEIHRKRTKFLSKKLGKRE